MLTQVNGSIAAAIFNQGFKWGCLHNVLIINKKEYQFQFSRNDNYYFVTRTQPPRFHGKNYKTKMDSASVIQRQFNHLLSAFVQIQAPPLIVANPQSGKEPDTRHHVDAAAFQRAKGHYSSMRELKTQHRVMEIKRQRNPSLTESVSPPRDSSYGTSVGSDDAFEIDQPLYDVPTVPPRPKDDMYLTMKRTKGVGSQLSLTTSIKEERKPMPFPKAPIPEKPPVPPKEGQQDNYENVKLKEEAKL